MASALRLERFDGDRAGFLDDLQTHKQTNDPSRVGEGSEDDASIDPALVLAAETASLHEAIQSLQADLSLIRRDVTQSLSGLVGSAVDSVLPSIATEGFRSEISTAVNALLRKANAGSAKLSINPAHHAGLVEALGALPEAVTLEVSSDPGLTPSEAQLRWDGGGADFDLAALTNAALEALRRRLDSFEKGN